MGGLVVKGYKYLAEPAELMPELTRAIKHNPSNGKLLISSMHKVHTYITSPMLAASSIKANNRSFRESGGITAVLHLLSTNNNELVLREATRLMLALAKDELNSETLRNSDVVTILTTLRDNNSDDEFIVADVKLALETVRKSCVRLETKRILSASKRRDIQPLFQALENQSENIEIVLKALTALHRLGEEGESMEVVYENDALLGYLLKVLKVHSSSAKTQILGMRVLFVLGKDPNILTILGRLGTVEIVKRALENHSRKLECIQSAIWVLRQFTRTEKLRARLDQTNVACELRESVRRVEEENLGTLILPLPIKRLIRETEEAELEEEADNQTETQAF